MAIDATSRVCLELYRSARESPIPEFQERALSLYKSIFRFDSALSGSTIIPKGGMTFESVHLHNLPEEMLDAYAEVKAIDRAGFEAQRRIGEVCNFNLGDMMPDQKYAAVNAFDKRWELRNLLVDTVYDKTLGSVTFIALYRADDRNRYTEAERLQGEALLPHFLEAGTINRLLWLDRATAAEFDWRGAKAIANRQGFLCAEDGKFAAVLRSEWPEWMPPVLPRALMEGIGRSSDRQFIGTRIAVDLVPADGMLFLHARDRSVIHSLTPGERAVAARIASGLSYKQVAKALSLSPSTVRNQLHSAYARLGVNNKVSLARLVGARDA